MATGTLPRFQNKIKLVLSLNNFILDTNKKILFINVDLPTINYNRHADDKLTSVFDI